MATIAARIEARIEANYPAIFGIASGVLALAYAPDFFALIADKRWKIEAVYSSVFNFSGISTAFLFAFYTFVAVTERGFLGQARTSRYFRLTMKYAVRAIILGFLLTIVSIPMMIIEPSPKEWSGLPYYAVAAWLALTGWAIA